MLVDWEELVLVKKLGRQTWVKEGIGGPRVYLWVFYGVPRVSNSLAFHHTVVCLAGYLLHFDFYDAYTFDANFPPLLSWDSLPVVQEVHAFLSANAVCLAVQPLL